MTKSAKSISMCCLFLLITSCGRDTVPIGQGNPDKEFKSCLQLTSDGRYEDAIQCMEMFKARYPKTPEGVEALLKIGDAQFLKKDYLIAAESYLAFLRLYPNHPKADYAYYRIGVCYFKESPKAISRDQQYLDEAIENLGTVVRRYPSSPYYDLSRLTLNLAIKRIAKRYFYIGHYYYRTGQYIAAIPRFKEVAEDFPDSGLADKALFLVVKSDIKLKRLEDAKEAFGLLSIKYASSKYTKKAESDLLSAAKKMTK